MSTLPAKLASDPGFREMVLAAAAESATQQDIADLLGVSPSTIARALAADKQLGEQYELALYNSSVQLLEQLRSIPDLESDVQRARLKVDALRQYLELRWPSRYGKRLELTVKHADMGAALTQGRERARAARLARGIVIEGQAVEVEDQALPGEEGQGQGQGSEATRALPQCSNQEDGGHS